MSWTMDIASAIAIVLTYADTSAVMSSADKAVVEEAKRVVAKHAEETLDMCRSKS